MFSDLTHDAAPLGTPSGHTPKAAAESSAAADAFKAPEVVNISGSAGVQIGPVYHINGPIRCGVAPASARPQDFKPQREHVLQMLQITREVSERDKTVVGDHLGDLWRALGREMDFSNGQLDNIDNDHRRLQDKVYELLTVWQDDKSSGATFAQLVRLLMRVRAFEVVSRLHKSLQS